LTPIVWAAAGLAVLAAAFSIVPRALLARAQDRLAAKTLSGAHDAIRLLTRAEMVVGRYRRVPGVLALTADALSFLGLFGESVPIPTSRIGKIETGTRLASGRMLVRREVLRITRTSGEAVEFVLSRASAHAWRSHLGLWAMAERQRGADRVEPGRS
jgi:hypothetical protein